MTGWIRVPERVTVPVAVDAMREVEEVAMARAVYFVVVSEVPWPYWVVEHDDDDLPALHLLGSIGVIYGPRSAGRTFTNPDQLDEIFRTVDEIEGLWVEIEDIWLPETWLSNHHESQLRDVYRVDLEQFQAAYRFRNGDLSLEAFLAVGERGAVTFSDEETAVYHRWGELQIEEAKALYAEKGSELKLESREAPTEWRRDV